MLKPLPSLLVQAEPMRVQKPTPFAASRNVISDVGWGFAAAGLLGRGLLRSVSHVYLL